MKSLILFSLFALFCFNVASADDDEIELSAFGSKGIRPWHVNAAVSEHVPFMASIRMVSQELNEGFGNGHYCGGVFLTRNAVLTVATCVKRTGDTLDPASLVIISGSRYRYDGAGAIKSAVKRIVVHPDFVISNIPNNVAVIFLSAEISADVSTVETIPMSSVAAEISLNLQIFGWGTPLVNNGPRELQTGALAVLHRTTCPQSFINRICAGPSFYGGCQGDDGGAVVANRLLYGLVDYRSDTYCTQETPVPTHLFVDVFAHRDWIQSTVFGTQQPTSQPSTTLGGSALTASVLLIVTLISLVLS